MFSIPDKAGWGFHWISSGFSFCQLRGSNKVLDLYPEPVKDLGLLVGIRVYNSGGVVTGKRIDWEKDVTSGKCRHFQLSIMDEMIKTSRIGFQTKQRDGVKWVEV